jgi:hypothetical protein
VAASSAGGLESPGALWVTLQNPFFPTGCGGRAPFGRRPKPHHFVSPDFFGISASLRDRSEPVLVELVAVYSGYDARGFPVVVNPFMQPAVLDLER